MRWKIAGDRPIWIQLKEQMIKMIVSGMYHGGERLPSVRELAKDAGVNPNTMQRALASLDHDGLTITNRTTGRCVTEEEEVIAAHRRMMADEIIRTYLDGMNELGYTEEESFELLRE